MPERLDPYYQWLGIPPSQQPPDAYRLLGLRPLESDPQVIRTAAQRQMAYLRTYQLGEHSALSQRLLNEVAAAQSRLLNPAKKAAYDRELSARREAASDGPPEAAADAVGEPPPRACPLGPPPVSRRRRWRQVRAALAVAAVGGLVLVAVLAGRALLGLLTESPAEAVAPPVPPAATAEEHPASGLRQAEAPPTKPKIVIETKTPGRRP